MVARTMRAIGAMTLRPSVKAGSTSWRRLEPSAVQLPVSRMSTT